MIPIFKLEFEESLIEQFGEGCKQILRSDSLAEGHFVKLFEEQFARYANAEHAVATGSGTDALEIAFRAVGVGGKKVVVPTNTFMATAIAAEHAGAEVLLCDIEETTFSLDPACLRDILQTESDVGAVCIVHIGGIVSDQIEATVDLCREFSVPLIEDAAHAHGAARGTHRAGTIGVVGCFSFFPTKIMTTGEGGMTVTNDPDLAARMRSIKNFGRDPSNSALHIMDGSNCKMTEFQALLGCLELGRIEKRSERRRLLAARYRDNLKGTGFAVYGHDGSENSFYKQIVIPPMKRDDLRRGLSAQNIALTGEVYRIPLHAQPVLRERFSGKSFPMADRFCARHICPPLYPELELAEIDRVCDVMTALERKIQA